MSPAYQVLVSALRGVMGGVDVFSMHLVRGLNAQGIPASILLTSPDDPHPVLHNFPSDIPVQVLPVPRLSGWRGQGRALVRHLEAQAPCVYLPNYDYSHSCISPRLSRRVSVVGIMHSDDPAHYEHAQRLGRYWDAIVAVTPAIARAATAISSELASRMTVIPYGVDVPAAPTLRRRAAGEPLRVVYHGRLAQYQKRVLDLGRVMAAATGDGVAAELTVIGDGPDAPALQRRCAPLVRAGTVRFLGPLPNADALRVVDASDAFLLTSEFEGLPVSLLEAMARGCVPIVADTRSGIPDLVQDGVNGFRVPVGDIDGFAERLARLAADDELRRRMGTAAHAAVAAAPYRHESMLAGYRALFDTVTERAAAGVYQRPAGRVVAPPSLRWGHIFATLPRLVRAPEWWAPKLAPLLAMAYLGILLQPVTPVVAYPTLVALLAALTCLAAYGHAINDVCDVASDRAAGKPNGMAALSASRRAIALAALAVGGVVPWLLIPPAPRAAAAWGVIYLLLTAYSAPPFRFKERGVAGVLTDAAMAHAAPTLFVCLLFAVSSAVTIAATAWALCAGLRNILLGQLWDHSNDIRSGTVTFTVQVGPDRARWLARDLVFPAELVALAVLLVAVAPLPWLPWAIALAAALDLRKAGRTSYDPAPPRGGSVAMHDVYQVWLPLILSAGLALRDWRFALLPVLQIVLFRQDLRKRGIVGGVRRGFGRASKIHS